MTVTLIEEEGSNMVSAWEERVDVTLSADGLTVVAMKRLLQGDSVDGGGDGEADDDLDAEGDEQGDDAFEDDREEPSFENVHHEDAARTAEGFVHALRECAEALDLEWSWSSVLRELATADKTFAEEVREYLRKQKAKD